MPVPNSMADLATLASSNFPTGTEAIGNSLDNYIRAISAIIRSTNAIASASIASASTTDIALADGESVAITGTSTINSFGTGFTGCYRELRFSGALTITNSANIVLPAGLNLAVSAGDAYGFRCTSSGVWQLVTGKDPGALRRSGDTATGVIGFKPTGQDQILIRGNTGAEIVIDAVNAANSAFTVLNLRGSVVRVTPNLNVDGSVLAAGSSPNPSSGVNGFAYKASGGFGAGFALIDGSDNIGLYSSFGNFNIGFGTSGGALTSRLTLDKSSGDLTVSGNLISNSDESLKSDWNDLPGDLVERLASVVAGDYYRVDTQCRQVGVGANSMTNALPLAVSESAEGIKSVAYGNAALVGVVALARRILELEARLEVK